MKILLTIFLTLFIYQLLVRIIRRFLKFPAPAIVGPFLDSRWRKKLQPPVKVINRSGIKKGMSVLEIGCGSGAFTLDATRKVGKKGKVYALDIEQKMLSQLKTKLKDKKNKEIKNIELVCADARRLPFKNNFFDLVFMVGVLQEIPDVQKALKEIKRVLKPSGALAVTEFLPDPDYPLKSTTIKQAKKADLTFDKAAGNLWNYTVRFRKK